MKNPFYDWKSDGTYGGSGRRVFNHQRFINWILFALIGILFILLFSSCSGNSYQNEKFLVVDKGSYSEMYFTIAKIDTYKFKSSVIDSIFTVSDTLFTTINNLNYNYHENLWWDQLYYSKHIGDMVYLESINKKRFWRKIYD